MAPAYDSAPIRRVAIACQGGASHTAFTAGALKQIFQDYADQETPNRSAADRYQILGLSGTSGGSICAFLAWYGLITGGPPRAIQLLDTFWGEGIAAQTFLEDAMLQAGGLRLLRTPWGRILQTLAELMGAPYLFNPQAVMDAWATLHIGPLADLLAPRPEHVNMERLFAKRDPQGEPLIDPEHIAHIGHVQRTLQQISKIISELNVLPEPAKNAGARLAVLRRLAQQAIQEIEIGIIAPEFRRAIHTQLDGIPDWQPDDPNFTAGKKKVLQPLPTLLLGAVDVLSGAFKAFDSRKGEISLQSVLASTILPELFQARAIGNQEYWDGLYSENPPVRGFVELPDERDEKPDEIWLIKIDPRERLDAPDTPDEIADRRNELAGDLSLNQELSAIETINQWLGKLNAASRRKYKHVSVLRVQLEETAVQRLAGGALDYPSKLYRGRAFVHGLMAHGGDQVRAFLPVARQKARLRRLVDQGWNALMSDKQAEGSTGAAFARNHILISCSNATLAKPESAAKTGSAGVQEFISDLREACVKALATAQPGIAPNLYVTIDDLIVEACHEPAAPHEFLAACRWTLRGTEPELPPAPAGSANQASPAERRSVKIQGTWVSRMVDDQIVASWVWDTRDLTPQPRPTVPPEPGARACRKPAMAVVRRWLNNGWRAGDLRLVDECFATDYVHHDSGAIPDTCGRGDYKVWLQGCAPRPDLTIEHLFSEGDRVVAVLRWGVSQLGVVIYRVAGGEIQESWWTWDTEQLVTRAAG